MIIEIDVEDLGVDEGDVPPEVAVWTIARVVVAVDGLPHLEEAEMTDDATIITTVTTLARRLLVLATTIPRTPSKET